MMTRNDIEKLFRSNYPAMLTLANRLLHDPETARDIVHDRFVALLTDSPDSVSSAFLLNGVRYACLNHLRNISLRARLNKMYALDFDEIEDGTWPNDDDVALLNSFVEESLPVKARRVLELRFNGKLTYKEIGEQLGISEGAVYKNLRHALDLLRQKFLEK